MNALDLSGDGVELLPCPFCGGTDLTIRKDYEAEDPSHSYARHVFCNDCHCHGRNNFPIGWCECDQSAIEAWNLRGYRSHRHAIESDRLCKAENNHV